ncbi:O-antigen ligase family protein [Endozoicomonas sp. 2B-B]
MLTPDLTQKKLLMAIDFADFNETISGGSKLKQVFWLLFFGLYIFSFFRELVRKTLSKSYAQTLLFFFSVILMLSFSYLWSKEPAFTLKRLLFQVIFTFTVASSAYYSIKNNNFFTSIYILMFASLFVGILSIIMGVGMNGIAFSGWAVTKNTLGAYLLVIFLLYKLAKNIDSLNKPKRYEKNILLFLFIFLLWSMSKTSIALLLSFYFLQSFKNNLQKIFTISIIIIISLIFFVIPMVYYIHGDVWYIAQYIDASAFTGRGILWDNLYYDLFSYQKLINGYGYGAYFATGNPPFILDDQYSFTRFISSAHNSYIELALQIGAALSLMILGFIILTLKYINSSLISTIIFVVFVHGLFESSLLKDQHVMWFCFVTTITSGFMIKNGILKNESSYHS